MLSPQCCRVVFFRTSASKRPPPRLPNQRAEKDRRGWGGDWLYGDVGVRGGGTGGRWAVERWVAARVKLMLVPRLRSVSVNSELSCSAVEIDWTRSATQLMLSCQKESSLSGSRNETKDERPQKIESSAS